MLLKKLLKRTSCLCSLKPKPPVKGNAQTYYCWGKQAQEKQPYWTHLRRFSWERKPNPPSWILRRLSGKFTKKFHSWETTRDQSTSLMALDFWIRKGVTSLSLTMRSIKSRRNAQRLTWSYLSSRKASLTQVFRKWFRRTRTSLTRGVKCGKTL